MPRIPYNLDVIGNTEESLDPEKYVMCTYVVETPSKVDILSSAESLALEQTTGTWLYTPEILLPEVRKRTGKVFGIYDVPTTEPDVRRWIYRVGYPIENFGNSISVFLACAAGNIWGLLGVGSIRWVDVKFPKSFVRGFKGPKFGIEGIRKYLHVKERPLVGAILKPCTGLPPDKVADLCYKGAVGGLDFIKEDELLGASLEYCLLENRLSKVMEALDRAEEETSEKTLYAINITDDGNKILENADKVIEGGCNCIMIDHFVVGLQCLRMLAEDSNINVPIFGHATGPVTPYLGRLVKAKLQRLCGNDWIHALVIAGKFGVETPPAEPSVRVLSSIRAPFYDIKPSMPQCSGGVHAGIVPLQIDYLGMDITLIAGGGVFGHPNGPMAGARSMRQAVDAYMKNVPLEQKAKENKELATAIEKWGIGTRPEIFPWKRK